MSTTTPTHLATQVYQIFIKATPEQLWAAITKPEFTARYFHGARITVTPDHYESLGPDDAVWGDAGVETIRFFDSSTLSETALVQMIGAATNGETLHEILAHMGSGA